MLTLLPRLRYFSGGPLGTAIVDQDHPPGSIPVFPPTLRALFLNIPNEAYYHRVLEMVVKHIGPQLEVLCLSKSCVRLEDSCLQLVGELKQLTYLSVGLPQSTQAFDELLAELPRLKGISLAGLKGDDSAVKGTEFGAETFVQVLETVIARAPQLTHLTLPYLCMWEGQLPVVLRLLGELKELRSLHLLCWISRATMCPQAGAGHIIMVEVGGRVGIVGV